MTIDKQQKKKLIARAQQLKPFVMIGSNGLTENVFAEIEVALNAHELIKVRISGGGREERNAMTEKICEQSKTELIQSIGHVIAIYRARPKA